MAKRTFKIGEYCSGGIIAVEITKDEIIIINKEWDFSKGTRKGSDQSNAKERFRDSTPIDNPDLHYTLRGHLLNYTNSYYAGKIIDWIATKVPKAKEY